MSFKEFQTTRKFVNRLNDELAAGWGCEAGYTYVNGFWIVAGPDDNLKANYLVVIGAEQTPFETLDAAERHLYKWARSELWL